MLKWYKYLILLMKIEARRNARKNVVGGGRIARWFPTNHIRHPEHRCRDARRDDE
jgi:hypothetical protein